MGFFSKLKEFFKSKTVADFIIQQKNAPDFLRVSAETTLTQKHGEYYTKNKEIQILRENDYGYGIIKDFKKEIFLPEYDKKASLHFLLSKVGFSPKDILNIISQENDSFIFNNVLQKVDAYYLNKAMQDEAIYYEVQRIFYRILIKFIGGYLSVDEATELFFYYALLKSGEILHFNNWNLRNGISDSDWYVLNSVLTSKYDNIIKRYNHSAVFCFAYFAYTSNISMDNIMRHGYEFLENNTKNFTSPAGALFQSMGAGRVYDTINRIIQVIIDYEGKIKTSGFLLKKLPKTLPDNEEILRYNVNIMKKHKNFQHSYIFSDVEKEYIKDDLKKINFLLKSNKIPTFEFTHINFNSEDTRMDFTEFTNTGKIPKVPYKIILFSFDKRCMVIEYGIYTELKKFEYRSFNLAMIIGEVKDGKLVITNIK